MKFKLFLLFIFCLLFACSSVPIRGTLPERTMIGNIGIERGQGFVDCIPVTLEAVFKFYGKSIQREEIGYAIMGSKGTRIIYMLSYVRGQNFDIYTFRDRTLDKRILKSYLVQGFPVIVLGGGRFGKPGHTVILVGYDERAGVFYIADPEREDIQSQEYSDFNEWHSKKRNYGIILYPSGMVRQ